MIRRLIVAVAAVFLIPSVALAQTPSRLEVEPPPGFEDLLAPQTTLVDVIYSERVVGTALATFKPGELVFADPAEVVELLLDVGDRVAVARALTGPLPTMSERACGRNRKTDCGTLEPAIAGIIFDESRFRVHLFVNAQFLATRPIFDERFMRPPDGGPSLVEFLSGAATGGSDTDVSQSLFSRTVLGYRRGRARGDILFTSEDNLLVDELAGEIDRPGWLYSGGLFRTTGLDLIPEQKIIGVGVGSSTATRIDLEQTYGGQLVVFLPRRAEVSIFRDGRLLGSRFYDAGNQVLDTRFLPDGAYVVELLIRDINGEERTEQRFFIKSAALPPADQPLLFFELGAFVDDRTNPLPAVTSTPIVRAGTAWRLSDSWALGGGLISSDREAVFQANSFLVTPLARLRATAAVGTRADLGASFAASGSRDSLGYSVLFQRLWSRDAPVSDTADNGRFDPIRQSRTSFTGRMSYGLDEIRLGFSALWQDAELGGASYALGPSLTWRLWSGRGASLLFESEALKANSGLSAFARFRVLFTRPHVTVDGDAGVRTDSGVGAGSPRNPRFVGRLQATVHDGQLLRDDYTLTAGIDRQPRDDFLIGGARYVGDFGRADVAAEQAIGAGATRFNGAFQAGFAADRRGVAVGGREQSESAVIVRLEGSADGAEYEVRVDRMTLGRAATGRVRVGESLPMFLQPYDVYEITLRPVGAPFTDFAPDVREVALFPGTVKTLVWRIDRVVEGYGARAAPRLDIWRGARRAHNNQHVIADEDLNRGLVGFDLAGHRANGNAVDRIDVGGRRQHREPDQLSLTRLQHQAVRRDQQAQSLRVPLADALLVVRAGSEHPHRLDDDEFATLADVVDLDILARRLARSQVDDHPVERDFTSRRRCEYRRQRDQAAKRRAGWPSSPQHQAKRLGYECKAHVYVVLPNTCQYFLNR